MSPVGCNCWDGARFCGLSGEIASGDIYRSGLGGGAGGRFGDGNIIIASFVSR